MQTKHLLYVDKDYRVSHGGFAVATKTVTGTDFAFRAICSLFFDIGTNLVLNEIKRVLRGTGRGVDCRASAIHPARSEPDGPANLVPGNGRGRS